MNYLKWDEKTNPHGPAAVLGPEYHTSWSGVLWMIQTFVAGFTPATTLDVYPNDVAAELLTRRYSENFGHHWKLVARIVVHCEPGQVFAPNSFLPWAEGKILSPLEQLALTRYVPS